MLPRVNVIKCNEADYMIFQTKDVISNSLYTTGQWEEYLLFISKLFFKDIEAPLIIDIGANLGAYSIPIAKTIQSSGGQVIGFEPQKIVYYQLCGNIILNRLDNYTAFNKAVGEFNQEIQMPEIDYNKNHNIGAFSLDKNFRHNLRMEQYIKKAGYTIPMIKIDSLDCKKSPSLIKIDIEGYELQALKGAKNFLEQHQYPPILFEAWSNDWFKEQKTELLDYIKYLGYKITLNIKDEYLVQHPKNLISIHFYQEKDNSISAKRIK